MRKLFALILLVLFTCGCSTNISNISEEFSLRNALIHGNGCSFIAKITTDDSKLDFTLDCRFDAEGNMDFSVMDHPNLNGIVGRIDASGGKLIQDDLVLSFPLLAQGRVSPVSAPWMIYQTLRNGYVRLVSKEESGVRYTISDTLYEEEFQLDVWVSQANAPIYAEIIWEGMRILSIRFEDYKIL